MAIKPQSSVSSAFTALLFPNTAQRRLVTQRLELVACDPSLAQQVLDFVTRNRDHFAPWDPPTPDTYFTLKVQTERLENGRRAFTSGEGYRYWMRSLDDPGRIIGHIHFSAVVRGALLGSLLGYGIDRDFEGKGLMSEAVRAGIDEMFSRRVLLHRIQAAHLPENARSAAVLARLGFEREGLARKYLFINGAWRDHVVTALINDALEPKQNP